MRIGVLIGGSGRTLKNFLDLGYGTQYTGKRRDKPFISCVVAHKLVPGLQYAAGEIPYTIGTANIFPYLESFGVDLAVLAGWVKKLDVPDEWMGRVINIHPSLLPAFGGKGMYGHHVHEAVKAAGVKESGCTVHYVDNEYDHGTIIEQRKVPVHESDTPETIAARVFEEEKILYPKVIESF